MFCCAKPVCAVRVLTQSEFAQQAAKKAAERAANFAHACGGADDDAIGEVGDTHNNADVAATSGSRKLA